MIQEKPDAGAVPDGPVALEFDDVRFAYPSADKFSLASLEEVAHPRHPGRRGGPQGRLVPGRAGPAGGPGRLVGRGQVHHRLPGPPPVRRRQRVGEAGRASTSATSPSTRSAETLGMVTQDGHLFHDTLGENLRFARPERHRRGAVGRPHQGPAGRPGRVAARRARHAGGGAGLPPLGRRAPAPHHRPPAAGQAPGS